MANLFQVKPQNTKVELSIGTAYLKPLPMSLLSVASTLGDKDSNSKEQAIAFAMIIKDVMVDEHGNPFDDLDSMGPEDIASAFSLDDFTHILTTLMPSGDEVGKEI